MGRIGVVESVTAHSSAASRAVCSVERKGRPRADSVNEPNRARRRFAVSTFQVASSVPATRGPSSRGLRRVLSVPPSSMTWPPTARHTTDHSPLGSPGT